MKLTGHLNRINAFYDADDGGGEGGTPAAVVDAPAPEVVGQSPTPTTPEVTNASPDSFWRNELLNLTPEQIGKAQNKGWENVGDLLNSYDNAEAYIGVPEDRVLKIPESDDAEGTKAMFQRLGAPADVEGYKFEFAEGVPVDQDMYGRFKEELIGSPQPLTKEQHDFVVGFQVKEAAAQQEAAEAAIKTQNDADLVELKNKWGSQFEERYDYAERAMRASGMTDDQVTAMQSVLGGPAVAEHFSKFADMMGEDKIAAETGSTSYGTSPEQVRAEIQDIYSQLKDPKISAEHTNDLNHPNGMHSKLTKRLAVLRAQELKFKQAEG